MDLFPIVKSRELSLSSKTDSSICLGIIHKTRQRTLCQTSPKPAQPFVIESSIYGGVFDIDGKKLQVQQLDDIMGAQEFWNDPNAAQKVIFEANELKAWIDPLSSLVERIDNLTSLTSEPIEDESFLSELQEEASSIEQELSTLEARRMLSGEMDSCSCFLSINAGAGGTESCDWVQMLLRMYERWATKRGWKVEVVDTLEGDVAGIRSVTIRIEGKYAYGYAKAERGVHRLVRISPFDSNARRHTSFAAVDISPEVADDVPIEIRPEDLRVDTYRASGAGGQHVNKTDSAVRILHIPTGIIVSSQSQRSQVQNREYCLKLLRSKLYEKQLEDRHKMLASLSGEKKEIGWGNQIRSYVFQPYTLVKDTRTKYEIGDVQSVMDGNIDPFIETYLKEFGGS